MAEFDSNEMKFKQLQEQNRLFATTTVTIYARRLAAGMVAALFSEFRCTQRTLEPLMAFKAQLNSQA